MSIKVKLFYAASVIIPVAIYATYKIIEAKTTATEES